MGKSPRFSMLLRGAAVALQYALQSVPLAGSCIYLVFGRTLLNALLGYPVLVDVCLWLMILAPLSVALVEFGIYVYSKLVG